MPDFTTRLNELCLHRGWTLSVLAKKSGVCVNTLYNWKNHGALPDIGTLEKIASAFQLTVEQFFCGVHCPELSDEENSVLNKWILLGDSEKEAIKKIIQC